MERIGDLKGKAMQREISFASELDDSQVVDPLNHALSEMSDFEPRTENISASASELQALEQVEGKLANLDAEHIKTALGLMQPRFNVIKQERGAKLRGNSFDVVGLTHDNTSANMLYELPANERGPLSPRRSPNKAKADRATVAATTEPLIPLTASSISDSTGKLRDMNDHFDSRGSQPDDAVSKNDNDSSNNGENNDHHDHEHHDRHLNLPPNAVPRLFGKKKSSIPKITIMNPSFNITKSSSISTFGNKHLSQPPDLSASLSKVPTLNMGGGGSQIKSSQILQAPPPLAVPVVSTSDSQLHGRVNIPPTEIHVAPSLQAPPKEEPKKPAVSPIPHLDFSKFTNAQSTSVPKSPTSSPEGSRSPTAWRSTKLIFGVDAKNRKTLMAGTVWNLLPHMFNDETRFVESFFYLHSYYVQSSDLLTYIINCFIEGHVLDRNEESQSDLSLEQRITIQFKAVDLLLRWYGNHRYQFSVDPELMKQFIHFFDQTFPAKLLGDKTKGRDKLKQLKETIWEGDLLAALSEADKRRDPELLCTLTAFLIKSEHLLRSHSKFLKTTQVFTGHDAVEFFHSRYKLEKSDCCKLLDRLLVIEIIKDVSSKKAKDSSSFQYLDTALYEFTEKKKSDKDILLTLVAKQEKEAKKEAPTAADEVPMNFFGDFNPIDIAKELTLIEYNLFKTIAPTEFLHQAWSKAEIAQTRARNLVKMIDRFNEVSYWVATEIVMTPNLKQRTEVLRRFINVAEICRQYNNFSTMMQIIVGLNLASVQRMERTWKALAPRVMQLYKSLMLLTSATRNYANYREALNLCESPVIPYIGVYLRDITFMEDGNDTYINKELGMINVEKIRMLGKVFSKMRKLQQKVPFLESNSVLHKYLMKDRLLMRSDDALKKQSLISEPAERTSLDARVAARAAAPTNADDVVVLLSPRRYEGD